MVTFPPRYSDDIALILLPIIILNDVCRPLFYPYILSSGWIQNMAVANNIILFVHLQVEKRIAKLPPLFS